MIGKDYTNNLKEILEQLQEAARHLKTSLERCKTVKPGIEENTLIEFEALTSRFARVADMLIHKVYRSIDSVEFVEGGTIIDVMNRADKRNLIDSVQEMRILYRSASKFWIFGFEKAPGLSDKKRPNIIIWGRF